MPLGNPQCFEKLDSEFCGIVNDFGAAVTQPFLYFFGDLFLLLVWAMVFIPMWLTTKNPLYMSICGLLIVSTGIGINEQWLGIGLFLIAITITTSLYQLFMVKAQNPSF